MKLTTLGGAGFVPNPGQGCSSYLIETEAASILLDCGPGTLLELRKHVDYTQVDAIFVSHLHADHILDLVPYRYGLVYGSPSSRVRIKLYLPPTGLMMFDELARALDVQSEGAAEFWSACFDITEYDMQSDVEIGDLSISFSPTQHFVPCNAIRVHNESGSIFYTADTGRIDQLVDKAAGANLLISEATSIDHKDVPRDVRGHLTPEDAGDLARLANTELLVISHLWSERSDDEVIRAARKQFSGNIAIAKPGSVFNVG